MARGLPRVVVVGVGRVGGALAGAYQRAGGAVAVLPRSARSAGMARALGLRRATPAAWAAADLCMLAVPDRSVGAVARELAPRLSPSAALVHCAGALSLDALGDPAALGGRPRGSFDPLRAISTPRDELAGAAVAIAASSRRLKSQLRRIAQALRLLPLSVDEGARARYHASLVLAAGGFVALLHGAVEGLKGAGLTGKDAKRALLPLVRSALEGVERGELSGGLTGPVARGDVETVRRNLEALPEEIRPLYALLMTRAVSLATGLSAPARRELRRTLSGD